MSSNIQPFVFTTSSNAVRINITCQELKLFNNAVFRVDALNVDGNIVNRQYVTITNEQYLAWNNDDSYILNLVATELGFTLEQSQG